MLKEAIWKVFSPLCSRSSFILLVGAVESLVFLNRQDKKMPLDTFLNKSIANALVEMRNHGLNV